MQKENQASEPNSLRQIAIIAAVVATGYYLAALVSLAQRFPSVVSHLWLPNAFLLGVLLMTQRRHWWLYLSAALPSHVLAHAPVGVPFSIMVVRFASNIGQAVLSAVAVQYFIGDLKRFDRLRDMILFIIIAGIIVPALVSLLIVGTFVAIEWVDNFPQVWRTRFLSNVLATLTITPLTMLAWDKAGSALPAVSVRRCTEASALMLSIVATGLLITVSSSTEPYQFMALLYLPLPFLLWAAVRFGLGGVCLSVLLFGEVLVLDSLQTGGPFVAQSSQDNALAINLFLSVTVVPLLMLAVLLKERNQSEQSIRESENIKNAIIRSLLNAIITIDHQGKIIEFNPEAERMFGYSRAKALGNSLAELIIPPSLRERHSHGLAHNLATGESRILGKVIEMQAMRADGSEFPAELSVARIDLKKATIFAGGIRDLTERKRTELREARLRQWQSLEAIGQITASVAHDFANLLTPILGNLHLLEKQPDHPRSRSRITAALAAAERGEKLVRSLLAFARQEPFTITIVDVNSIVGQMKELLSEALGSVAALTIDLAPDIWPVKADESGLELAVINLVINSRDAITANGAVRFSTSNAALHGEHDGLAGDFVEIAVCDTGSGMSPEVRARAFEPLFTTKGPGKGTGLGLASIYGFSKRCGGTVTIDSEIGKGTTVTIYLPRAESPIETPPLQPD